MCYHVSVSGCINIIVHVDPLLCSCAVVLKDAHYMLFYMAPAIQTRMLVTFDEALNPLPVTVRVGQVRE